MITVVKCDAPGCEWNWNGICQANSINLEFDNITVSFTCNGPSSSH